jgi:hypothetical protein
MELSDAGGGAEAHDLETNKQTALAISSAPRCDIRFPQRDEIMMTGGEVWRYSGAGMLLRWKRKIPRRRTGRQRRGSENSTKRQVC